MTEIEYLKEQLEKADKFISQIENDCYPLIDEIIDTVCKNVIKRINTESKQINLCDDLPKEFTFFDQLSVLHQSPTQNGDIRSIIQLFRRKELQNEAFL